MIPETYMDFLDRLPLNKPFRFPYFSVFCDFEITRKKYGFQIYVICNGTTDMYCYAELLRKEKYYWPRITKHLKSTPSARETWFKEDTPNQ